jgi:opacity protein-like surface antigen
MRLTIALVAAVAFGSVAPLSAQQAATPPPAPRPLDPMAQPAPAAKTTPAATGGRIQVAPSQTAATAEKPTGFVVQPPQLRQPATGWNAAIFGGANLFQTTTASDTVNLVGPGPSSVGLDGSSRVDGAGGLKFGYVWSFDEEPIDQFQHETGGMRLSGGMEVEAFWVGNTYKGNNTGGPVSINMDAAVFMLNPTLRAQFGNWRPYIGGGIGVTYISASDYSGPSATTQSEDDTTALAYQGIAGVDYFISPEWSVFTEFKYLVFSNFDLYSGGAGKVHYDDFQQGLLTFGVRKGF